MRKDSASGNIIGSGEDTVFEILQTTFDLKEIDNKFFPEEPGLYRQVPVNLVLDNDQLRYLADFHKKSSIDIFMIPFVDEYTPHLSRVAIRVEGKKGTLKMQRQGVQRWLLEKWCRVVDVHKYESTAIFKEKVNEKSKQELQNAFDIAKVELRIVPAIPKTFP
jgi:hypothetical protein